MNSLISSVIIRHRSPVGTGLSIRLVCGLVPNLWQCKCLQLCVDGSSCDPYLRTEPPRVMVCLGVLGVSEHTSLCPVSLCPSLPEMSNFNTWKTLTDLKFTLERKFIFEKNTVMTVMSSHPCSRYHMAAVLW